MPPVVNELGHTYGNLKVIARDTSKSNRAYWICECTNCGAQYSISGTDLRRGHRTTCPQCEGYGNTKNEKGNIYGNLLVLEKDHVSKDRRVYWKCQCQKCGKIIIVDGRELRNGSRTECSECHKKDYPQYINEVGHQYGELTVLQYDESRSTNKNAYWICQCSCGNVISVSGIKLRYGQQSCGCINSKGERKINQILSENNIAFETQKTFDTCRFPESNRLARFDFYLPDYNILMEYDGEQHSTFRQSGWDTKEKMEIIQARDHFKDQWCEANNIPLIRIPYTDFDKITIDYLLNLFNQYKQT